MITMQVGNKNVVQPRKLQAGFSELQLGTFPTINHEKFIPHIEHL